ncbi:hypothetical protein C8F04DRAFT_1133565 [Mycena alexandri]|uniref:Transmembrane protein n=1 Tax=Mycena alexandri TaxID=1745969 RepID=A0AAD6WSK4_9AGAR|nr:hypothetical protein C8F04DRAFT_1133565 [Mycena alexandri]
MILGGEEGGRVILGTSFSLGVAGGAWRFYHDGDGCSDVVSRIALTLVDDLFADVGLFSLFLFLFLVFFAVVILVE